MWGGGSKKPQSGPAQEMVQVGTPPADSQTKVVGASYSYADMLNFENTYGIIPISHDN
ncbi:hypothetical protein TWF788_006862 [Orbilia oligospora]|uniref:Uncharacterized protein n=1 Tax=Orbilia oligospora TaxID=2813651 RepID=A0A7C8PU67_ORBOL|nr:hypothetical protein TWF788_006862 [Orbilia oligospora]